MIIEVNGEKIDVVGMSIPELIGVGLSSSEANIIHRISNLGDRCDMIS